MVQVIIRNININQVGKTYQAIELIQNTGVDRNNTQNYISGELTTGKTYHKFMRDSSEVIKFSTILTKKQLYGDVVDYHKLYLELKKNSKTQSLPVIILNDDIGLIPTRVNNMKDYDVKKVNGLSFNGVITSLTWKDHVNGEREYSWEIAEQANFTTTIKDFQTFNYKKATVNSNKNSKTKAIAVIKYLYKCGVFKADCNKRGRKCVRCLQRLIQSDGYYKNYIVDGLWCKYTQQEFKKWQRKKAKIRVSGVWDKNCRAYIKKRFKI